MLEDLKKIKKELESIQNEKKALENSDNFEIIKNYFHIQDKERELKEKISNLEYEKYRTCDHVYINYATDYSRDVYDSDYTYYYRCLECGLDSRYGNDFFASIEHPLNSIYNNTRQKSKYIKALCNYEFAKAIWNNMKSVQKVVKKVNPLYDDGDLVDKFPIKLKEFQEKIKDEKNKKILIKTLKLRKDFNDWHTYEKRL